MFKSLSFFGANIVELWVFELAYFINPQGFCIDCRYSKRLVGY